MKKLLFFSIILLLSIGTNSAQNRISHKGNEIFLAGINLAWMQFGNDLTQFNPTNFESIMKNISEAGGNSARWWIHIDGRSTPTFNNDTAVGIDTAALDNLEKALDIAAEHGIVLSLCLWSFDMMHVKKDDETELYAQNRLRRNRLLLEDSAASMAYITNALIPMIQKVKGHTALLCWEIFNEPEGMTTIGNWSHVEKIAIHYIQRFTNWCAAAIHNTDPEAKVSTGAWNAIAATDINTIPGAKNYYSDENLLQAGGKIDGYLDFYMLHYYPEWYGEAYSPFHNPAEHWQLDKPLLIGEYSAHGIIKQGNTRFTPRTELSATEALLYLYNNGYAGGWGWTYTGHDGHGNLNDMKEGLDSLRTSYPEHILIPRDPNHNYAPKIIATIADTILYKNSLPIDEYVNLNHYFTDDKELTYSITASSPMLATIITDSLVNLHALPNATGHSIITVKAIDAGGKSVSQQFTVSVRDSIIHSDNKLLYALVRTSSQEDTAYIAPYINDGDMNTRWSSKYENYQWIEFDMLKEQSLSRIVLHWEAAYAEQYSITYSTDKIQWDTIATIGQGQKDKVNILFAPTTCRYIKIELTKRATSWGYSLHEVEAYSSYDASLNKAPTCTSAPIDIRLQAGKEEQKKTTIKRNKFTDENGDLLEFELNLQDCQHLEQYIHFNPYTVELIVKEIPISDTGSCSCSIKATDYFGLSAELPIQIIAENPTSVSTLFPNAEAIIYPMPVTEKYIHFAVPHQENSQILVQIYNLNGKKLYENTTNLTKGQGKIHTPTLVQGNYIIIFTVGYNTYTQKLIME